MKSLFVHSFIRFNREDPFLSKRRNKAFSILLSRGNLHNFSAYLSSYDYYNKSNKKLKKAWIFDGKWKKVKNIKVDLFYYHGKTRDIYTEVKNVKKILNLPILNHLELELVCDDKLLTYNIFSEMMPKTFLINNFYGLQKVLHFIKTDKIVLKPRDGSNGDGVLIMPRDKLKNGIKKNTIAQEFIDSSYGVCGIKKQHDLRVVIIDGKIDHCYLRIPKNGSFLANAAQGASKIFLEASDLPSSILKRVKIIDKCIEQYGPRVYTADFVMDPDKKSWLIELNSKPGMLYYDNALKTRVKFYDNLYKIMHKLC